MKKKIPRKWIWIILFIIILIVIIELFFGLPIGVQCGYWSAFGGTQKSCECIGIKTGSYPFSDVSDSGAFGCVGICQNCICKQWNVSTHNLEEVPCD